MFLVSMEIKTPKVLNRTCRVRYLEQMKRAKETKIRRPKHADYKLQIKGKKKNSQQNKTYITQVSAN